MKQSTFISVYADTSVFGGVYDEEFDAASIEFFDQIRGGKRRLVVSDIVGREIESAPEAVRQAYLNADILTSKWLDDALHVALATVSGCDVIVSWNFKHIVHFQKIPRFNAVNAFEGYHPILIHSPREVLEYEDEDF